jgi:hypothetical protein
MTINRNDKSTSISTQLDSLIPASKISTLTQGMFVGSVSDNFDERIEQKIFHAEIVVDNEKVAAESKAYQQIPQILSFVNEQGEDKMKQEIENNYKQIKSDILNIVSVKWSVSRMTLTYSIWCRKNDYTKYFCDFSINILLEELKVTAPLRQHIKCQILILII